LTPSDIVLASVSPRRLELLKLLVRDFRVEPSGFDESCGLHIDEPEPHVLYQSGMKAREVAARFAEAVVIGADTIVVVDDRILGKPADEDDAAAMLRSLSGRVHQVYTGIAVISNGRLLQACECTDVRFRELSPEVISRYIDTGEPMDKAGAYAIQGKGAALIERIDGCFFNVVGLPIYRLSRLLEQIPGVGFWV
jgi:septum formation protein